LREYRVKVRDAVSRLEVLLPINMENLLRARRRADPELRMIVRKHHLEPS
jgi:hypothetical protein